VLSALIGNFANKVACFSRIVLPPIAKSHVKLWSVREHDTTLVRLFLPFVFVQLRFHQQKILTSFFGVGRGLFGLILAASLVVEVVSCFATVKARIQE